MKRACRIIAGFLGLVLTFGCGAQATVIDSRTDTEKIQIVGQIETAAPTEAVKETAVPLASDAVSESNASDAVTPQPIVVSDPATPKPTEAPTEAPTEPPTEAPTEPPVVEAKYVPYALDFKNKTGVTITSLYLYEQGAENTGNCLITEPWPDKDQDEEHYEFFAYVLRPEGVKMDLAVTFEDGSEAVWEGLTINNNDKLSLKKGTDVSKWEQEAVDDPDDLAAMAELVASGKTTDLFYPGYVILPLELKNKTNKQDKANARFITEFYLYETGATEAYGNMVEFLVGEDGQPLEKWGYGKSSEGGIYAFGFFIRPEAATYEVKLVFEDGTDLIIPDIDLLTPNADGFLPNEISIKDSLDPDFTEVSYDDGDPEPLQYLEQAMKIGIPLDNWYPTY